MNQRTSSHGLLAPAPFLKLLADLDSERQAIERRSPHSDLASAVASFATDLSRAIDQSRHTELWVNISTLHELTGKPVSTLRRICELSTEQVGAKKVHGTWSVHWPTFERAVLLTNSNAHQQ